MIELQNIEKTFGKGEAAVHALRGVTLTVQEGEMVAIMGKSGCGKSTLLNIMSGLLAADSGVYRYRGSAMEYAGSRARRLFRRDTAGIVLQYFALLDDRTVAENVALPLRYQGLRASVCRRRVQEALALLELSDKAQRRPGELSGGQQQRVAIARAMVKNPDILFADEPTGALDEETEGMVMEHFRRIHAMGKTVILVTHDEGVARQCQRVLHMKNGRFV